MFFINRRLEDQNILDPDNDLYIFVLHHLAHPLMRNTADKWLKGWNEHGISTERNMTPVAMWITGLRKLQQGDNESSNEPELD